MQQVKLTMNGTKSDTQTAEEPMEISLLSPSKFQKKILRNWFKDNELLYKKTKLRRPIERKPNKLKELRTRVYDTIYKGTRYYFTLQGTERAYRLGENEWRVAQDVTITDPTTNEWLPVSQIMKEGKEWRVAEGTHKGKEAFSKIAAGSFGSIIADVAHITINDNDIQITLLDANESVLKVAKTLERLNVTISTLENEAKINHQVFKFASRDIGKLNEKQGVFGQSFLRGKSLDTILYQDRKNTPRNSFYETSRSSPLLNNKPQQAIPPLLQLSPILAQRVILPYLRAEEEDATSEEFSGSSDSSSIGNSKGGYETSMPPASPRPDPPTTGSVSEGVSISPCNSPRYKQSAGGSIPEGAPASPRCKQTAAGSVSETGAHLPRRISPHHKQPAVGLEGMPLSPRHKQPTAGPVSEPLLLRRKQPCTGLILAGAPTSPRNKRTVEWISEATFARGAENMAPIRSPLESSSDSGCDSPTSLRESSASTPLRESDYSSADSCSDSTSYSQRRPSNTIASSKKSSSIMLPIRERNLELSAYWKTLSLHFIVSRFILPLLIQVKTLHDRGIVHLDIKPSNMLWDATRETLLLCDFGLSAAEGEPITLSGELRYAPFEILNKASTETIPAHPSTDMGVLPSILSVLIRCILTASRRDLAYWTHTTSVERKEAIKNIPITFEDLDLITLEVSEEEGNKIKDFLTQLAQQDPKQRPTIGHTLTFFKQFCSPQELKECVTRCQQLGAVFTAEHKTVFLDILCQLELESLDLLLTPRTSRIN
jgi:hypothetical protein